MVKEGDWDRQGDDCAYVLRGIHTGRFNTWAGFQNDPSFETILSRHKSNKTNLKRNFDRTVKRYNDFISNGTGEF